MTRHRTIKVSVAERQKASRIIEDLRRDYSRVHIADLFGIHHIYVNHIQMMLSRPGIRQAVYHAPGWAIKKVNEHGAMLGMRRMKT
jgi:hypothetical protein